MFKWYVIYAKSGQEKKAVESLKDQIKRLKLEEYFLDIVYPQEDVQISVKGKKRSLKKKIFPGYLLVHMIMNDQTWHVVKNVNNITGFLGSTVKEPIPLNEEEVTRLIDQMSYGFKSAKKLQEYSIGDKVKVLEGPFANFTGSVESLTDKGKLVIQISIFGRTTPVELKEDQIEKI